jgi:hypothetical protein
MRLRRVTLCLSVLMLAAAAGCKFSLTTANISGLKFSKDKEGKVETSTFAPGDTIYATATVSNVPSKVTLKFRLITEKVEGHPENQPVPNFDTSLDLPNDGYGYFTLTPPPAGWPAGRYRVEIAMLTEGGEQKDQEAGTFTVSR